MHILPKQRIWSRTQTWVYRHTRAMHCMTDKHTRVVYGSNFLVLRLEITEERIDLLLLSEKQIMRAGWVKVKWIEQHRYFADYDISWLKEV